MPDTDGSDPYAEPKRTGKFRTVKSGNDLTTEILVERILSRRLDFEARNKAKEKKELAAYEALARVQQETGGAINENGEKEDGDCWIVGELLRFVDNFYRFFGNFYGWKYLVIATVLNNSFTYSPWNQFISSLLEYFPLEHNLTKKTFWVLLLSASFLWVWQKKFIWAFAKLKILWFDFFQMSIIFGMLKNFYNPTTKEEQLPMPKFPEKTKIYTKLFTSF